MHGALLQVAHPLAGRILDAAEEAAVATVAQLHRLRADRARHVLVRLDVESLADRPVGLERQRAVAVGPAVARREPVARLAGEHALHRSATVGARGGVAQREPWALRLALAHPRVDLVEEAGDGAAPAGVARSDLVERLLHASGEREVDDLGEVPQEERDDDLAQRRGEEASRVLRHVRTLLERRDDRGVGGRPPDAVLLERLDERALAVARGWGRLVRVGDDRGEVQHLTLVEVGQTVAVLLDRVVLVTLHPVSAQETVEPFDLTGDTEHDVAVRVRTRDVGSDTVEHGGRHLCRDGARPDQLVQARLLAGQVAADAVRRSQHGRRADRLVRLLRTLGRVGRAARLVERVAVPVLGADEAADLIQRLVGEIERVGPHVGDEPDLLAATECDALVQLLGDRHRLTCAEADARPLALQRRGLERRLRVALLLGATDLADGVGQPLGTHDQRIGLLLRPHDPQLGPGPLVLALEVLRGGEAQPVDADHPSPDVLLAHGPAEQSCEVEVGLGDEGADLVLAVDDQPQRDRLDATGGDARRDRAPQHRRESVPDDAVDGAAGLLRLHECHVEMARVGERSTDRRLGDLVERDAVGGRDVQAEDLSQMPGDRLTLTVEVGGEPDGVRRLRRLAQRGHVLRGPLGDLVGEAAAAAGAIDLDGEVGARQITDVPVRGQHGVARAEVALDRLGLRRRLDDDEVLPAHEVALRSGVVRP